MSLKRNRPSKAWSYLVQNIADSLQQRDAQEAPNEIPVGAASASISIRTDAYGGKTDAHSGLLLQLPDATLFHVLSFVAAPTHRAGVVCHQLAPLSHASHVRLLRDDTQLWQAILQQDYGVGAVAGGPSGGDKRRCCKRLERSPLERVMEAHRLVKDNTEIAFYYLSELVTSSGSRKAKLTKKLMMRLMDEYGPNLRINQRTSTGGLFLVEVCRARNATEAVVLLCVRGLIENHGALVNLQTFEATSVRQTALFVASVRGMPNVVKYLLKKGACPLIRCSGRFKLHTNSKKTMRFIDIPCLEAMKEMKGAELAEGASERDLTFLSDCIDVIQAARCEATIEL